MDHIKNSPNSPGSVPQVVMVLPEPNDINSFSPWEIDFRQVEAGEMETKVRVRAGRIVTLLNISMSRAVHQTGVSPKGLFTFGIIRRNDVHVWQGQDTSASELLSFGSSDPFDGVAVRRQRGFIMTNQVQEIIHRSTGYHPQRDLHLFGQGIDRAGKTFRIAFDILPKACSVGDGAALDRRNSLGMQLVIVGPVNPAQELHFPHFPLLGAADLTGNGLDLCIFCQ